MNKKEYMKKITKENILSFMVGIGVLIITIFAPINRLNYVLTGLVALFSILSAIVGNGIITLYEIKIKALEARLENENN